MPATPSENELEDDGFEAILLEMAALEAVLEANREEGSIDRARYLARQAWSAQKEPTTFEQYVVRVALSRVVQEPLSLALPSLSTTRSWTEHVYECISLAWLRWLTTGDRSALGLTERLQKQEPSTDREPEGAVELSALTLWCQALEKLVLGDEECAKRLFERAIETGSQIGSDSNPTINWSYAASFFPH